MQVKIKGKSVGFRIPGYALIEFYRAKGEENVDSEGDAV
jgi:hypothetical protein